MIGPPGLPKPWRRSVAAALPGATGWRRDVWKWAVGLYVAGILAHFGHHMAFALPQGGNPSLAEALTVAPVSLAWPADLVGTLMQLG